MDDYDIPFDDMSDDDFMYRAMDDDDPMYMGDDTYYGGSYIDTESDYDYYERVTDWYNAQYSKIIDAMYNYINDPDDDPKHYFENIKYDPFPRK